MRPRCCQKCSIMFNLIISNIWCQIVLVPNCPVPNCPGAKLSWCQIVRYQIVRGQIVLPPSGGEIVASNKTVTVGKHFTLFLKTTTLQGYFLSAFFSAILPPRVQFTTQKWFLEFPLYPFSISKTRYKAKAAN